MSCAVCLGFLLGSSCKTASLRMAVRCQLSFGWGLPAALKEAFVCGVPVYFGYRRPESLLLQTFFDKLYTSDAGVTVGWVNARGCGAEQRIQLSGEGVNPARRRAGTQTQTQTQTRIDARGQTTRAYTWARRPRSFLPAGPLVSLFPTSLNLQSFAQEPWWPRKYKGLRCWNSVG